MDRLRTLLPATDTTGIPRQNVQRGMGVPSAADLAMQQLKRGPHQNYAAMYPRDPNKSYDQYGSYGALEKGNIDLSKRPHVKNADGSTSTVRSMGVGLDDKNYLLPTVSQDGRIMNPDDAIDEFFKTGQHMGVYPTEQATNQASDVIHEDQVVSEPEDTLKGKGGKGLGWWEDK